jgi:hypothetical protein
MAALARSGVVGVGVCEIYRCCRRFTLSAETNDERDRRQQPTDEPSHPKVSVGAFHAVGFHGRLDSVPDGHT